MQKLNLWQFNSKSQKVVLCNRWHALHSERNSTAHGLNFRLSDRVTEACGRVCARSQGTQADPDPSMSFVDSLVTLLNCSNFVPQSGCQPIEPDWPDAIITVGVLLLAEKMRGPQRTRYCPISSNVLFEGFEVGGSAPCIKNPRVDWFVRGAYHFRVLGFSSRLY